MAKYNMTFEEAQEYISKRGFDIPWNDCDVFIDERYITQTVGNVLKWADNNPKWKPSDEQMEMLENVRKILHTNKDIYSKANNLMCNFEELIRTLKKLRG